MRTMLFSSSGHGLLGSALLAALLAGCAQPPQLAQPAWHPFSQMGNVVDQPQPQALGLPQRVFPLSALDGNVAIAPYTNQPTEWTQAALNWPVSRQTWLRTAPDARVEFGDSAITVRMGGATQLVVDTAGDSNAIFLRLSAGTVSLRLRRGEMVRLSYSTVLVLVVDQPGEYRLDVDPGAATMRVTARAGVAKVEPFGGGSSMSIASGQQVTFSPGSGGILNVLGSGPAPERDALDQWAAARDALREPPSVSASHVAAGMPGIEALDGNGQWAQDPDYGAVWYPTAADSGWTPYTNGNWAWIDPWGWTWVDAAPWGFAPFHYGRWTLIGARWAWAPGPQAGRSVYAPALIGFGGGSRNSGRIAGRDWFPLAPGEYWQPAAVSSGGPPSGALNAAGVYVPYVPPADDAGDGSAPTSDSGHPDRNHPPHPAQPRPQPQQRPPGNANNPPRPSQPPAGQRPAPSRPPPIAGQRPTQPQAPQQPRPPGQWFAQPPQQRPAPPPQHSAPPAPPPSHSAPVPAPAPRPSPSPSSKSDDKKK